MLVDALWQLWAYMVWLLEKLLSYAGIFIAIAAAAAWFSAINTLRALRANQKAFEGKLLSDLMNEYASADMTESMEAVGQSFGNPTVRPSGVHRRRVSHYFQKIYRLCDKDYIDRDMARAAIRIDQAAFFLRMEPLEDAVRREGNLPVVDGDDPFGFYAELYGLPRIKAQPVQGA
jgi:hypothetical protein